MESTIFLAKFWGWLMVLLGLTFLLKKKALLEQIFEFVEREDYVLLSGFVAFFIGLTTVILHNVWVVEWPIIITILGWLSLIKGIVRIGFPWITRAAVHFVKGNFFLVRTLLIILVLSGAWLLSMSWG